ncbi:16532_t:CDS:2, partial [Racocetra persica]
QLVELKEENEELRGRKEQSQNEKLKAQIARLEEENTNLRKAQAEAMKQIRIGLEKPKILDDENIKKIFLSELQLVVLSYLFYNSLFLWLNVLENSVKIIQKNLDDIIVCTDYQPQLENNTFLCFHCRQHYNYKTQCGLDFPAILGRDRFLICDDDFKKSGGLASNTKIKANRDDTFFCFITHKTYDTKQELSLVLEAND